MAVVFGTNSITVHSCVHLWARSSLPPHHSGPATRDFQRSSTSVIWMCRASFTNSSRPLPWSSTVVSALMTTGAFSQNVEKVISELKLVTDNLSLYLLITHLARLSYRLHPCVRKLGFEHTVMYEPACHGFCSFGRVRRTWCGTRILLIAGEYMTVYIFPSFNIVYPPPHIMDPVLTRDYIT